jgi:hypothetical protein
MEMRVIRAEKPSLFAGGKSVVPPTYRRTKTHDATRAPSSLFPARSTTLRHGARVGDIWGPSFLALLRCDWCSRLFCSIVLCLRMKNSQEQWEPATIPIRRAGHGSPPFVKKHGQQFAQKTCLPSFTTHLHLVTTERPLVTKQHAQRGAIGLLLSPTIISWDTELCTTGRLSCIIPEQVKQHGKDTQSVCLWKLLYFKNH